MALPLDPFEFSRIMDPADRVPRKIDLTGAEAAILVENETMTDHTLTVSPEAVARGFRILNSGGYEPQVATTSIIIWLEVDEEFRNNTIFDGEGVLMAMELTMETNSIPSKRYQRTIVQRVAQQ